MTEEEKEIQKALGLFKTYSGYVQAQGNTYYDVYEVRAVSLTDARDQLYVVVKKLQKKSKMPLKLVFIADDREEVHVYQTSSNIKN